jgi:hypothetical protein
VAASDHINDGLPAFVDLAALGPLRSIHAVFRFVPFGVEFLMLLPVEGQCLFADGLFALHGTAGLVTLRDVADARVFLGGLAVFVHRMGHHLSYLNAFAGDQLKIQDPSRTNPLHLMDRWSPGSYIALIYAFSNNSLGRSP